MKKAVFVLIAAIGINLIVGITYIWTIIGNELINEYHWTSMEANLPNSLSLLVLVTFMVFGGRLADLLSPRICTLIGGTLLGSGLFLSSFAITPLMMLITYGVLVGAGVGFCCSATTANAIKWFPVYKKGMISGICMAGTGLAAVYLSPLVHALITLFGIAKTFQLVGISAFVVVMFFTLFLSKNTSLQQQKAPKNTPVLNSKVKDIEWKEMLKSSIFYKYWIMFIFAASAGLMIFGNLATIAVKQAQWENGFLLVILLAIFNSLGRILAGMVSDRIGVINTLRFIFLLQAANMILFNNYHTTVVLGVGSVIAGLCYGGIVSVFPAVTAGEFGMKNLGVNYAFMNTAYGIGGTIGPIMAGLIFDSTGSFHFAYIGASALLILATVISYTINEGSQKFKIRKITA